MFWSILLFVLVFLLPTLSNPQGNHQRDFQHCLHQCLLSEDCDNRYYSAGQSMFNRLFLWDCKSECQYRCMWDNERIIQSFGLSRCQYYGKWPFPRVMGIQELGSVAFSIGNFVAHLYGYNKIYKAQLGEYAQSWFLHRMVFLQYIISLNGWLWSTVFHGRETQITTYLDYFSAIAIVFSGMCVGLARSLSIHSHRKQLFYLIMPVTFVYIYHVHYLLMVDFDFGWNMRVLIIAAEIYIISFFAWSVVNLRSKIARPSAKYSLAAIFCLAAASLFEIRDFPPIFYFFDAHAVWHAATIPIIILWYKFYALDGRLDLGLSDWHRKHSGILST